MKKWDLFLNFFVSFCVCFVAIVVTLVVAYPTVKESVSMENSSSVVIPEGHWVSNTVTGEAMVIHAWGRTAVTPARTATVHIKNGKIIVSAKCDRPLIGTEHRDNYCLPFCAGELNEDFPGQTIQTIKNEEIISWGDDWDVVNVTLAVITFNKEWPVSLLYTRNEYACFDVKAELETAKNSGDMYSDYLVSFLEGFDDYGFRTRSFKAINFTRDDPEN